MSPDHFFPYGQSNLPVNFFRVSTTLLKNRLFWLPSQEAPPFRVIVKFKQTFFKSSLKVLSIITYRITMAFFAGNFIMKSSCLEDLSKSINIGQLDRPIFSFEPFIFVIVKFRQTLKFLEGFNYHNLSLNRRHFCGNFIMEISSCLEDLAKSINI